MRRKPLRRDPMPETLRDAVFRRDGDCMLRVHGWHTCYGPLHAHHIRLRSAGGNDDSADGLAALCQRGHQWVHNNVAAARAYGLIAPKGSDVSDVQAYAQAIREWFTRRYGPFPGADWLTREDVTAAGVFDREWAAVIAQRY